MRASRTTTRPRPSLNCKTCRRRKVRCTKERPACQSCVRTKDVCEYDNDQYQNAKTSDRTTGSQGPKSGDDDWVNWTVEEFAARTAQSSSSGSGADQSNGLDHSSDHQVAPLSPAYSLPGDGEYATLDAAGKNDPSASNEWQSLLTETDHTFATPTTWTNTSPTLGNRESSEISGIQARHGSSNSISSAYQPSDQLRKRPRHSIESVPDRLQAMTFSPVRVGQEYGSRESSIACRELLAADQQETRIPGYLITRNGASVRHVNPMFWAYVKGNVSGISQDVTYLPFADPLQEDLCEHFIGTAQAVPSGTLQPHIDSVALAALLSFVPPKPVCNALLHRFLVGVRPLCPLIHVPTFRLDYEEFWRWYENSSSVLPNDKLVNEPTFLCLLFSILYCGAVTSSAFWATGALHDVEKGPLIKRMEGASTASLKYVQHMQHPTYNTLVASLLRHSCSKQGGHRDNDAGYVTTVMRLAQAMGFHLEASPNEHNSITREMQRRVWWHILWLDVQDSAFNGSPLYYQDDVCRRMVAECQDKDLTSDSIATGTAKPLDKGASAAMLYAIGRFETTRYERLVIRYLLGSRPHKEKKHQIGNAFTGLETSLRTLIARIPAQGVPEKGLLPSKLANASPGTHKSLYSDQLREPTAFGAWIRIMLIMLKTEANILFEKVDLEASGHSRIDMENRWSR